MKHEPPEAFLDEHGTAERYDSRAGSPPEAHPDHSTSQRQAKRRFTLVPFCDIAPPTASNGLIKGLFPREGLICVYGAPKSGKSFWTFDAVSHIALGWEYRGRRVKPGAIVYIALEGERGISARIEAFRRARLKGCGDPVRLHLLVTRLDLAGEYAELIDDIRAQLDPDGCVMVVIDTLNRSLAGSESSDEDMSAYVRGADAIREAFRCAVLVIHHSGLDATRPRGHTSLLGAVDAQIKVERDAAEAIVTTVEYMKDGETGATTRSTLKVVEVGTDEDGDTITSCVIETADDGVAPAKKKAASATGAAKVVLDLLRRALGDEGKPPPASSHIPRGTKAVVPVDLWRRYAYDGSVADSDKRDSHKKAFARAVTKLQAAGIVGIWGGYAWLAE